MDSKFTLIEDHTNCQHWLDGPTRVEGGWEVGRCANCHQEIAYKLKDGNRTSEAKLVLWTLEK